MGATLSGVLSDELRDYGSGASCLLSPAERGPHETVGGRRDPLPRSPKPRQSVCVLHFTLCRTLRLSHVVPRKTGRL